MSPFLLIPVAAWVGKTRPDRAKFLALPPAGLAFYFAYLMTQLPAAGYLLGTLPWAPSLNLSLSFRADGLSLLFAIIISAIGSLITVFASKYFDSGERAWRFHATLFAFMGSMLGVVLSDNLFLLFVFWELTGFTSFLLIGFNDSEAKSRASAIQAFVLTSAGSMCLLAAAVLIQQASGVIQISALIAQGGIQGAEAYPWIAALLLLAAFTKSAQTPFHFWLPNAMAAPTPVSAYLHSATMVKAGIYLVARMTPIVGGETLWTVPVIAVGATTMAVGAWRSVAETDLKRILAYSTVSALGLMMMLLGVGTQAAVTAALTYLCAHAGYKGALFLVAGTLEHETGTRDILRLGGLRHSMPLVAWAGVLAVCSMAGVPLFLGFAGKELFYDALLHHGVSWARALLALTVGACSLLGMAGMLAGVGPFAGKPGLTAAKHKVPLAFSGPALALAAFGLFTGVWPPLLDLPIGTAVRSVLPAAAKVDLALWHGFNAVLALSLATLAAIALLYWFRDAVRPRIWPRSLGFERLYSGSVAALDAISAWSLPALQGASLRSYVRTLVLSSGILVTTVLFVVGLPDWPVFSAIQAPEMAATFMIILGTLSAVRAKSAIQAVLSLGVTGYGVALIFLFFGAPDLAMTQFSVETLTAVIFVLVFYRFPNIGITSAWKPRLGDAAIAVTVGGSIALALLYVATSPTPSTLSDYFSRYALPLAHGRNIVNVILVDFRAFDTLGEITVLATAAIGVRAVFRMGRRDGGPK